MTTNAHIPNSFQTPNILIDQIMPLLTPPEFMVLMYAVRHILGWRKRISDRQHNLSVSTFENGYTSQEDGKDYPGCGLGRTAILSALEMLEKYKVMKKVGEAGPIGQVWELIFDTPETDIEGLTTRKLEKGQGRKSQTVKARQVKAEKEATSLSDRPVEPVCATDQSQSVEQTDTSLSDRPNSLNTSKPIQTQVVVNAPERPTIFSIYESKIGLLTGPIGEELADLEKEFGAVAIEEAIDIALAKPDAANKWKYALGVLKRKRNATTATPQIVPKSDKRLPGQLTPEEEAALKAGNDRILAYVLAAEEEEKGKAG